MERKIGEIFEFKKDWYQCVEGRCKDCHFSEKRFLCKQFITKGFCNSNIIFKKLEKVGEPYVKRVSDGTFSTFQRYRVYNSVILPKELYIYCNFDGTIEIEIKQNKDDMEEKKDNYDGYMDKECIHICDVLNSIPNVQTTESCCGHCKERFMIFLTCDNPHSLAIIARVFDRRYIGTSQPWHIELQTKDSGAYEYFIHSETKYDSEEVMMKDVNQIIENIEHWCDDKFASHFKGCDDKPTLAPFDINLAKAGKPVCTRDGRKARIICFDAKGDKPIIALIEYEIDERPCNYFANGRFYSNPNENNDADLIMLSEKKEGWVNLYKNQIHNTFKSAEEGHKGTTDYIKTIKVEWEE